MNKKTVVFALFFVLSSFALVFAHPPTDILLTYDSATKILKGVIYHNVADPERHYIKKVDTGLNGKEIISQVISRQDNNATQTVSYYVPDAKPGDTLSVEAYCNLIGKLQKDIQVTK